MARGAERHLLLGHRSVGPPRVVGGHQLRDVDQHAGFGGLARSTVDLLGAVGQGRPLDPLDQASQRRLSAFRNGLRRVRV